MRDWGQEEKGTREDEMVGWHHRISGHESGQTLGDTRQGSLACCSPWGCKKSDMTEQLNDNQLSNLQCLPVFLRIRSMSSLGIPVSTILSKLKTYYFWYKSLGRLKIVCSLYYSESRLGMHQNYPGQLNWNHQGKAVTICIFQMLQRCSEVHGLWRTAAAASPSRGLWTNLAQLREASPFSWIFPSHSNTPSFL